MKRSTIFISTIFLISLLPMLSAQIIFETQPNEIYNLGDTITLPITIKTTTDVSGSFEMNLLCQGLVTNFYKNGINLIYGEEIKLTPPPALVLKNEIIGELKGTCKINAILSDQTPISTDEFKISTLINSEITLENSQLNPGESLIIEGTAIKESSSPVDGFVELTLLKEGALQGETQLYTINNGYFLTNVTIKNDLASGNYLAKLNIYEKNSLGDIVNQGSATTEIFVKQMPKNLELSLESNEIKPNEELKVKSILHDQTGVNILQDSMITIKDSDGKILEQKIIKTNEYLTFPIQYNQLPGNFSIQATANLFETEQIFKVLENLEIKIEMINKSISITNIGNVPYCNESVLVKIGNTSLNLDICLKIDENKQFLLTAPDGEYNVEVINDGKSSVSQLVVLTGNTVKIKETGESMLNLMHYPVVWLFIIGILGFMVFIVGKKGYKKSFFGYIKEKARKRKTPIQKQEGLMNMVDKKAELSLSIKGQKQKASIVCLKIKNFTEIKSQKQVVQDTLNKINNFSKEAKAVIYESQDNLFFILAPIKTKTFKNEKTALELAQKIGGAITTHNKIFKQRIEFGLSINNGDIIAKQEGKILKFMSVGPAITNAKKLAILSKEALYLSDDLAKKLSAQIKTKKQTENNVVYHTITQFKNLEEHKKFIDNFIKSLEKK